MYPVADLRGEREGRAPPPLAPNFFIFMQFSGKIGQTIGWRPPFGVCAPSLGKSWIRHWYLCDLCKNTIIQVLITPCITNLQIWVQKYFNKFNKTTEKLNCFILLIHLLMRTHIHLLEILLNKPLQCLLFEIPAKRVGVWNSFRLRRCNSMTIVSPGRFRAQVIVNDDRKEGQSPQTYREMKRLRDARTSSERRETCKTMDQSQTRNRSGHYCCIWTGKTVLNSDYLH